MLTEAEKKWLEEREKQNENNGYYFCAHSELQSAAWNTERGWFDVPWVIDTKDTYKDAAEFEARVAASIAQDAYNCAQDEMLFQHQEGDRPQGWYILRDARLVVEEEMEKEE